MKKKNEFVVGPNKKAYGTFKEYDKAMKTFEQKRGKLGNGPAQQFRQKAQKYAKQMLENNELAEKGIKSIDRITNFTTTLVTGAQGEYGDITNMAEGLAHEC